MLTFLSLCTAGNHFCMIVNTNIFIRTRFSIGMKILQPVGAVPSIETAGKPGTFMSIHFNKIPTSHNLPQLMTIGQLIMVRSRYEAEQRVVQQQHHEKRRNNKDGRPQTRHGPGIGKQRRRLPGVSTGREESCQ
jgi:hypothetical protein